MNLYVCDIEKYDCTMGHCDNCPDLSVLKSFLRNELLKIIDPDETIQFNQWVSTNRSQVFEEESEFDGFIKNLVGKFGKLTKHHYIAKKQTEFFKLTVWGMCYCSRFCRELFLLSPGCCPRNPLE